MADRDVISDWNSAYTQAWTVWSPWLDEAKKDLQCSLGDQWDEKDKLQLRLENRAAHVFNRTRRVIKIIAGFQRKNRLALKIEPVEGSDENTASQFSMLVQHIMQREAYHVMSEAFEGSLKTGINLVHIYQDYSKDLINGDFRFKRKPYNRFLIDPNFADRILGDAQYLLTREWLGSEAVKPLLPSISPKNIDELAQHTTGSDNKFDSSTPQGKDFLGKDLMKYDEFYLRRSRPIKVLIDPYTGVQKVWKGDKERLGLFLSIYPHIKVLDKYESYVELNIIVENQLMWSGPDPIGLGDQFPFFPVICFFDPEYDQMKWKLQGIVRCMRDPQDESNKRRSKMLDILDTQLFPYRIFEEDALVKRGQAYQSGQGRVLWAKKGALAKGKIDIRPAPDIPAGLFKLMEIMDKDLEEIPGTNPELFGTPENPNLQVAAFLSQLRQGASLTVLQDIFDNYRMTKKAMGGSLITLIQNNWTPAKVKRICNEEPTREFYDRNFGTYDAVPQEGILTDTQRHMYFAQLVTLKDMGAPIPWAAILDAAPIEHKSKLKQMIAEEEKRQAQAAQVEIMDKRLTQGMMQSKIASDLAKSQENRAQAIENMANATLDRIRTIKEIAKMDDEHIMGLIDWIRGVEAGETIAPAARGGRANSITRR